MSKKRKASFDNNAVIIERCVEYAEIVAGLHAAAEVEPCGNMSERMVARVNQIGDRAQKLLLDLAVSHASTREALQAKAAIVPYLIKDSDRTVTEPIEIGFLLCFAEDVVEFVRAIAAREFRSHPDDGEQMGKRALDAVAA